MLWQDALVGAQKVAAIKAGEPIPVVVLPGFGDDGIGGPLGDEGANPSD